jgi:aspartyl-tRNA(Asn)/glutamyl-tRNA(Gln) amidotransferase subunit C
MSIDPDRCAPVHLARLARLELGDAEASLFTGQLRAMILDFNRIGELDTAGVEPFAHPGDPRRTLRDDAPAPAGKEGEFLSVPLLDHQRREGQQ